MSAKSFAPVFSAIAAAIFNGFSSPACPPISSIAGSPAVSAFAASRTSAMSTGFAAARAFRAGAAPSSGDHAISAGTISVESPPFGRIATSNASRVFAIASVPDTGSPIQSDTGRAIE